MDHDAMSRTIRCPKCDVVLNLPDVQPGKRLKCPKCQTRFPAGAPEAGPASSSPGVADAGFSSTIIRPAVDLDFDLPTAAGDLRETFDLPMMMDADTGPPGPPEAAKADAASLFGETAPAPRRVGAAEKRSKTRRCPTCGGVVPAGMSLCSKCGLDLETGTRVDVMDILDAAPPPRRPSGPPVGIAIVGGTTLLASAILAITSFRSYSHGQGGDYSWGFLLLGLICVFGVVAAVQFLRGKTAKLLMVALMLAGPVDVVALIALPILLASQAPVVDPLAIPEDSGEDVPKIAPITERLDQTQLKWGIVILLVDAAVLIYLFTPQVRRHFERR
jgi:hypothetical protein